MSTTRCLERFRGERPTGPRRASLENGHAEAVDKERTPCAHTERGANAPTWKTGQKHSEAALEGLLRPSGHREGCRRPSPHGCQPSPCRASRGARQCKIIDRLTGGGNLHAAVTGPRHRGCPGSRPYRSTRCFNGTTVADRATPCFAEPNGVVPFLSAAQVSFLGHCCRPLRSPAVRAALGGDAGGGVADRSTASESVLRVLCDAGASKITTTTCLRIGSTDAPRLKQVARS